MKYILVGVINAVWLWFTIDFLKYFLYVYINSMFIPSSYRWESGKVRDCLSMWAIQQFIITNIEILLFILLAYLFNRWFLRKSKLLEEEVKSKRLLRGIAAISFVIYFAFNYMHFYGIFMNI
ncbi:MAG: hypothetical protein JKY48_01325 [Flavobacteriales bacterium]|nr:hypothetical protein [Flavobacteriales bacterium]